MSILRSLWADECGAVLSAELVMVGALGVIGGTVGLAAASHSVNEELKEFAFAIRSLDQSYCIEGRQGCRAWTAGSCYQQPDVEESRAELQGMIEEAERRTDDADDDDERPRRRRRMRRDNDDDRPRRRNRDRDRDNDDDEDRGARRRDRDRTSQDTTEEQVLLEESA